MSFMSYDAITLVHDTIIVAYFDVERIEFLSVSFVHIWLYYKLCYKKKIIMATASRKASDQIVYAV